MDGGTPRNLDRRTVITLGEEKVEVSPDNIKVVAQLGRGAYGIVERVCHTPTGHEMAVKVRDLASSRGMHSLSV